MEKCNTLFVEFYTVLIINIVKEYRIASITEEKNEKAKSVDYG